MRINLVLFHHRYGTGHALMICFLLFFFAVSENLVTFAAIKGSHWRSLPEVLSHVAVSLGSATFVRKVDCRLRQSHSSL